MTKFEHADITKLLPHRFPILLVDKVLELDKGSRIVAIKAVTGSEPCYAGLADDLPHSAYAFPTSLMVESFGQSGAILWLQAGLEVNGTLIFGAARDCKFEGAAYPGDVLRHVVHIDVIKGDNAFMYGEIWVADRRIATIGSMLAVVRETALLNS
jgi:3-hydroxyacyl-[acyl-carrier-protein] dehydratase